jgi:hypothetical protein
MEASPFVVGKKTKRSRWLWLRFYVVVQVCRLMAVEDRYLCSTETKFDVVNCKMQASLVRLI